MSPITYPRVWLHGAGPASLFEPAGLLSKDACRSLFDKIVKLTTGGGETFAHIIGINEGSAEWGLNRIRIAADTRVAMVAIVRTIRGASATIYVKQLDDDGLQTAVRTVEELVLFNKEDSEDRPDPYVDQPALQPVLWDDATHEFGATGCSDLVQQLIAPADAVDMVSTGALRVRSNGTAAIGSDGLFRYYPTTEVECSMMVRNKTGTASGWAGVNHYALSKIDPQGLAARALDKAQRSANPVAIEPGRYTAILEPQAMADLFAPVIRPWNLVLDRQSSESMKGPFAQSPGLSKITQQVLDTRLVVRSDPMDPDGGFLPFSWGGTPNRPVNWIDQGILEELAYDRNYALAALGYDKALPNSNDFRLTAASGVATSTVDEMIAKTERGVLVTRFSGVRVVDPNTMLCTGYTRDGLWLIEHGKVTKPVKNFRFNESPLFILNNLEEVGVPVRVFAPGSAYVAPPVRVRDFSFVALADAI